MGVVDGEGSLRLLADVVYNPIPIMTSTPLSIEVDKSQTLNHPGHVPAHVVQSGNSGSADQYVAPSFYEVEAIVPLPPFPPHQSPHSSLPSLTCHSPSLTQSPPPQGSPYSKLITPPLVKVSPQPESDSQVFLSAIPKVIPIPIPQPSSDHEDISSVPKMSSESQDILQSFSHDTSQINAIFGSSVIVACTICQAVSQLNPSKYVFNSVEELQKHLSECHSEFK